jgi:hypothetical protein
MYIVGAIEQGITELEEIYFQVPLIFPGTDKIQHTHTGKICDTQVVARHIDANNHR